jgi:hypothetical protein
MRMTFFGNAEIYRIFRNVPFPKELRFQLKKILGGMSIPDTPMGSKEFWEAMLVHFENRSILEFGSGGSTFLLSKHGKKVVSIESDKAFYKIMKKRRDLLKCQNLILLYANIGYTNSYGYPVKLLSPFFRHKYSTYTEIFFNSASTADIDIEVVFIDGRFRVWSVLTCLYKIDHSFTIIVDDYEYREEYHTLEYFLGKPSEKIGEAAIFHYDGSHFKNSKILSDYSNFKISPN